MKNGSKKRKGAKWQEQFAREAFDALLKKLDVGGRVSFTVTRNELRDHFMRRASHHITEASAIESGQKSIPVDFMAGRGLHTNDFEHVDAAHAFVKKDARERWASYHRNRAGMFVVMADHLAPQERFTLELDQLGTFELVPIEPVGCGLYPQVGFGG